MNKTSFLLLLCLFTLTQSVSQSQVLSCVRNQIGKPYVSGGIGPNSFDCCGLAYYCHNKGIPNGPSYQASGNGIPIPKYKVQPGDLMFWRCDDSNKNAITHTSICTGNGKMIHAPKPGDVVKEVQYKGVDYWESRFASAKRYWK